MFPDRGTLVVAVDGSMIGGLVAHSGPGDDEPLKRHVTRNKMSGQATNVVQVGSAQEINFSVPDDHPAPVTLPVAEYSPLDLEVHRSIQVAGQVSLPAYVPRPHDERLRELVDLAARGRSGVAFLVAGSSTGKTRACWEAIQRLPAEWRLWHPITPGRPEAAAREVAGIESHTVLWLNESHHYLLTPGSLLGEEIAAGIRDLLRDRSRGPVLVLGTLWPAYWDVLTRIPPVNASDPYSQARALLTGHGIRVAEAFTASEVSDALKSGDPLLAAAVEHGSDRQVTQYLAGAPALMERYEHAPVVARALLDVAMDARRLGHGLQLSEVFLQEALPGYLTDAQWSRLGDDWFTRALDYCHEICLGGSSPLVPIRPRPGAAEGSARRFRLEDYLEQYGRGARRTVVAPATLWEALIAHAPVEDLPEIGAEAEKRGLLRIAHQIYVRTATAASLRSAAVLLAGLSAQARFTYGRTVDAGDADSLRRRVELADASEAIALCRKIAEETGKAFPVRLFMQLCAEAGRWSEALSWLRVRAGDGDPVARRMLEQVLRKSEQTAEDPPEPEVPADEPAQGEWPRRGTDQAAVLGASDDPGIMRWVAEWHIKAKNPDGAVIWLATFAGSGNEIAGEMLAMLLSRLGRSADSVRWGWGASDGDLALSQERARGETAVLDLEWAELAAAAAERAGRPAEAIGHYRRLAAAGNGYALFRAVFLARLLGQENEIIPWLQALAEAGDLTAVRLTAEVLDEIGRKEEAISWYLRVIETGNVSSMTRAVALLTETDGQDAASRLESFGLAPGGIVEGAWPHDL